MSLPNPGASYMVFFVLFAFPFRLHEFGSEIVKRLKIQEFKHAPFASQYHLIPFEFSLHCILC